jgi:hypothetical protein
MKVRNSKFGHSTVLGPPRAESRGEIRNSRSRRGNAVIAIVVAVLALIFFAFAIVYYVLGQQMLIAKSIGEMLFGGGTSAQAAQSAALEPVDCGNGTSVPRIYLPIIKQAAKQYLGGDEAALIAVISIEAPGFRRDAISGTGAVGLGQFVVPRGPDGEQSLSKYYFQNLLIKRVPRAKYPTVTPAEKESFRQTYPNEGRLQPSPSIFASAHLLGNAIKKHGDLHKGYAEGYNGSTAVRAGYGGRMEKEVASDRVIEVYNNLRKPGGGCKELKDTPGQLGENLRKLTNP